MRLLASATRAEEHCVRDVDTWNAMAWRTLKRTKHMAEGFVLQQFALFLAIPLSGRKCF